MADGLETLGQGSGRTRGYFAIGAEQISKPMNLGNMVRSAHAFGASFVFTVGAAHDLLTVGSNTSRSPLHVPLYHWQTPRDMTLPQGCQLVGIELVEGAVELPSFRHPLQAAYVLGPERGELSPEILGACDHVVKIPTAFCINVAVAGAIVMYDRIKTLGRFAPPPVGTGGPVEELAEHKHGGRFTRR